MEKRKLLFRNTIVSLIFSLVGCSAPYDMYSGHFVAEHCSEEIIRLNNKTRVKNLLGSPDIIHKNEFWYTFAHDGFIFKFNREYPYRVTSVKCYKNTYFDL